MENTLRVTITTPKLLKRGNVLILVLMENTLRVLYQHLLIIKM